MRRSALVLVAVSACDYAFELEHITESTSACGPYDNISPVMITGVTEPRQFSITADEQLALVFGIDAQGRARPIPLQRTADGWEPHVDYQVGLDGQRIEGARLSPSEEIPKLGSYTGPLQPAMNVWLLNTNRLQVSRFYWSGTTWTADANQPGVYNAPDFDTQAGNVVLVRPDVANPNSRVRHTVITKIAVATDATNQIVLHANNLPDFSLLAKPDRTRALNEQAALGDIALTDGALTENQATLVYAGVSGGQSDIYATTQSALREFGPGSVIADITTNADEVEPWINETCSKLYFRRIPAGSPNDPGQIFVAQ